MKWSPLLHTVAYVSAIAGFIALLGAWRATAQGEFLGLAEKIIYLEKELLRLL